MSVSSLARKILPDRAVAELKRARKQLLRRRISRLPLLSEDAFSTILRERLDLAEGDTVYIHSSIDQLNLGFPFYRVLPLIQSAVGEGGTVLFPTYPNRSPMSSFEFLATGQIFDVRRSPSYTGLMTEFGRRQRGAIRSLHPTKSVCAIGPNAADMTATHQNSPYPYDEGSPYRKLIEYNAKIIGIGVWTQYLSFVYTVDDALKNDAPVQTYFPDTFAAKCINYQGETEVVETYAHDMRQVVHDIPRYIKTNIASELCEDLTIEGMKFFRASAPPLFDRMMNLARQGITCYPRSLY